MSNLKAQFEKDGFVIQEVLTPGEIKHYKEIMADLLDVKKVADNSETHSASFQHLGDELKDFAKENRLYYFHLLTKPGTEPIHSAFHHPKIMEVVEQLIGPQLIINNASILAANQGVHYNLGWHRDVIQIPQEEINDFLFSNTRFHNSVQINLALNEEDALWVVPGSHNRPNNQEEAAIFEGSKHYAPLGRHMPGGIPVRLKEGEAVFYNNNLIHRGYTEVVKVPRRTLHMGYHSATKPPTWHFYFLNKDLLTEAYLQRLSPTMQRMMDEYLACHQQYPRMSDTWQEGFWEL